MSAPQRSDALVFFGATGDLAYKQIFPALQAMIRSGALNVPIIGVARSGWTVEQLRARARDSLEHHGGLDQNTFDKLCSLLRYVDGDYANDRTFNALRRELGGAHRPLHYLAIPPSAFAKVVSGLSRSGCATEARVAVEKPFGRDLSSARALNQTLHQVFPESAIFRIDHYLGKEPVLNLLYFRFSNRIIESILNRDHVESVQITMAERFGMEGRGRFYEETGAIRDVIQNHMLQIIAILAMDPPVGQAHDMLPYERLLEDAMRGDASLFAREDAIEAQWRIVDPVLDLEAPPYPYEQGTWGPVDADRLVAGLPDGWQQPPDAEDTGQPRRTS